ncbi:helix-turn-helix transcriptional regulator [Sphingobium yanoikuyae]|uniref:Helix-turn-helix transcriptional regulator n=1 Tax=Sphingobium yanoikuyae TaxID=13690 RepID=A0A6M4G5C1_SPHYA|nr:AraC family transcriptional regulator [Sphingobium yanoikuyae]QJR02425.1 helix-turn-helix transcriptional regulator [Sphingobium yanoikuyae]
MVETLDAGIKLAVLLEGSFALDVDGAGLQQQHAAESSLFTSSRAWQLDHSFARGCTLHYLTLFVDAALVSDVLEADLPDMTQVRQVNRLTPLAMVSVTNSILHGPFAGAAGRLHAAGKALELAALAVDLIVSPSSSSEVALASASEARRLNDLHAYIGEHWRELPTLDQLARRFGFGLRAMTTGFRRLYGCSISEHARELRLREGWRLLDAGMSATLAAEAVGYTLPHFTAAFASRFGITPGALARHGTQGRKI